MKSKELLYWIWLSQIKGIGPIMSKKLLESFKTPENIFKGDIDQLQSIEGIGEKTAKIIVEDKDSYLSKAEVLINKCVSKDIKILTIDDNLYPVEAKNIKDSPIILYYRGNIIENAIGVGIVGSRRCNEYGKKVVKEAASYLAENNIPVISGMAKGIDVKNFPKRNRLISAFSSKLLVVEASEQSGSLITAKFSKQYGRQVFAVPSSIYSKEGVGTNKLELDSLEKQIVSIIKTSSKTFEEIKRNITETDVDILEKLSVMELEGKIKSNHSQWVLTLGDDWK